MNVLLLNMSTLNYNTYNFTVDPSIAKMLNVEWDEQVTYHGQLEPVPRFLIAALHRIGKKLDKIVVMNTQETVRDKDARIEGETKKVIAYDFFVDQITQACVESHIDPPEFKSFVYDENTEDEQSSYGYLNTVSRVVNYLRDLRVNSDEFHLYLDIHGGPRNVAYLNVAVINLLNVEGIVPEMNLTVNDRKGGKERIDYMIKTDSMATDMLDFTAAMRNFLFYGRAEGLQEYSKKYKTNNDNTRFLKIVYNISDAIITCDVNAFEESLQDLRKEMKRNITYEGELEIFKTNIRTSYGKLLSDQMTTFDQVDWCVQKGFIQQALTLIEAHMGEYLYEQFFIDRSVYYHKVNNAVQKVEREKWSTEKEKAELSKMEARVLYHIRDNRDWESLPHRLFSKWADANKLLCYISDDLGTPEYLGTNWTGKTLQKYRNSIHWIMSGLQKYKAGTLPGYAYKNDEEQDDASFVERIVQYPDLGRMNQAEPEKCHLPMYQGYFEKSEENSRKTVSEIYLDRDSELKDDLVVKEGVLVRFELKPGLDVHQKVTLHKILYMHFILVQYRNEIMHASKGKHVSTDTLRKDMKQYVDWMKQLI